MLKRSDWSGALVLALTLVSCAPSLGTLGASLARNNVTGHVRVMDVPANEGAARAGLLRGDEILYIDGQDVREMSAEQLHEALVGPSGTKMNLTVVREGRVLHLSVQRGELKRR